MPPLVAQGPDLPAELLQAHEEGRLILFCGAGISFRASLPSFKGLIDQTFTRLHTKKIAGEQEAYRAEAYDRVIELLERRIDRTQVRKQVKSILTASRDAPLAAHQSLLRLSQDREDRCIIITTNFDDLFTRAARTLDINLRTYVAPTIPTRPKDWHGLVHLHGSIDDSSSFILSSSDFGRAYLTEGWASRFLRDLFREFSVLFVGYGITDPIVRYLTDALASQRLSGESYRQAWVLAGVRGGRSGQRDRQRWSNLGVESIFYNKRHKHILLYRTLCEWAHLHKAGLQGRAARAVSMLTTPPDSPNEDDARMVVWALSDPSGTPARLWTEEWTQRASNGGLSESDYQNGLEWLKIFEESEELGTSHLLSLPNQTSESIPVPVVGAAQKSLILSKPTYHLAQWLALFLGHERFLRWLVSNGCLLHPQFADIIQHRLAEESELTHAQRSFLSVISLPTYQQARRASFRFGVHPVDRTLASATGKSVVLHLLQPIPVFTLEDEDVYGVENFSQTTNQVIESDLSFAGDDIDTHRLLDLFCSSSKNPEILASYTDIFSHLTQQATEWLKYLFPTKSQYLVSWQALRAIHPVNRALTTKRSWSEVVVLAGRAIVTLASVDLQQAKAILDRWFADTHPLFERLTLHAITQCVEFKAAKAVELLVRNDNRVLWDLYCRRERERFLRLAAGRLNNDSLQRLESQILRGPQIDTGEKDEDDTSIQRDHQVWRLLSKMTLGGAKLSPAAAHRLAELENAHHWQVVEDYQDELLVYSVEFDREAPLRQLLNLSLEELARTICRQERHRINLIDGWDDFVSQKPGRALSALRRCAENKLWPSYAWETFLLQAPFVPSASETRNDRMITLTWRILSVAPPATMRAVVGNLGWLLRETADSLPDPCVGLFLNVWDMAWEYAPSQPGTILSEADSLEQTLNHPAGHLVEALINWLISQRPAKNSGLPSPVLTRVESALSSDEMPGCVYARCMLAAHLSLLFFVDPIWVTEHLIPLFSWEQDKPEDMWIAFLHRARWTPDLLDLLKSDFIETVQRREELPSVYQERMVELLAILGVQAPRWTSMVEQRDLVHKLSASELPSLIRPLVNLVRGDMSESAKRWREAVGPWLIQVLPMDKPLRTPEETDALSALAIETGSAFPDALAKLKPYLIEVSDSRIAYLLDEHKRYLVEEYPKDVLSLLCLLVPETKDEKEPWAFYRLREVLKLIVDTAPELEEEPCYRQLMAYLDS